VLAADADARARARGAIDRLARADAAVPAHH
jgi:hypothetical protein